MFGCHSNNYPLGGIAPLLLPLHTICFLLDHVDSDGAATEDDEPLVPMPPPADVDVTTADAHDVFMDHDSDGDDVVPPMPDPMPAPVDLAVVAVPKPIAPIIPPKVFSAMPSAEFMSRLPIHFFPPWGGKITFYKSGSFECVCPNEEDHGNSCRQTRKGRMLKPLKYGQSTENGHGRPLAFLCAWGKLGLKRKADLTLEYPTQGLHYPAMPSPEERYEMRDVLEADESDRAVNIQTCERVKEVGEVEPPFFM